MAVAGELHFFLFFSILLLTWPWVPRVCLLKRVVSVSCLSVCAVFFVDWLTINYFIVYYSHSISYWHSVEWIYERHLCMWCTEYKLCSYSFFFELNIGFFHIAKYCLIFFFFLCFTWKKVLCALIELIIFVWHSCVMPLHALVGGVAVMCYI